MKTATYLFTLCFAMAFSAIAQTAPDTLKKGDVFPAFKTADQHGAAYEWKAGPRFLIVSYEMSVAKSANKQLEAAGADFLPQNKAVYMSDILGMPKIGRIFALPKMRKYPHKILLADAKGLLDAHPKTPGKLTIFSLNSKGAITDIRFWDPDAEKLADLLK